LAPIWAAIGCIRLDTYLAWAPILKWTTLSLFAYVATALVVDVPWGQVAYTFVPSFT